MIPLVATVAVRSHRGTGRGLWLPIPLFVIWLVLLPFAVLLTPVFVVACLVGRVNPIRAASVLWQFLTGLTRTRVDVDHRDQSIRIRIH